MDCIRLIIISVNLRRRSPECDNVKEMNCEVTQTEVPQSALGGISLDLRTGRCIFSRALKLIRS